MLLGKRPRPPIRRTTSMTGITSTVDPVDPSHQMMTMPDHQGHGYDPNSMMSPTSSNNYGFVNDNNSYYDDHGRFLASMVLSPRNVHQHQRSSSSGAYVIEPPNFLRTCGLCRRRLASGRDIYMYRGDTAFCSHECREKRMKQDERKEKYSEGVMATRENKTNSSSTTSKTSTKGETCSA